MTTPERRKSPRFAVDVPARLSVGNDVVVGRLRDVCRDAALVVADRSFALETEVSLAMELPGTGGPMLLRGKIVRLAPGDQGGHGMAILFHDITPAAAARIDFFIAQQEG
jgi:hypothetical protein